MNGPTISTFINTSLVHKNILELKKKMENWHTV